MNSKEFVNRIVPLSPRIYSMANRILGNDEDARDAVQEIMIRLWKGRNGLNNHPNVNGFVFLLSRNYCLDIIKKKKPDIIGYPILFSDTMSTGKNNMGEQEELFTIVRKIIDELPDNQKDIVIMRDLDGLEFEEIATISGINLKYIRVLLSRARKRIGLRLTEIYNYQYEKN